MYFYWKISYLETFYIPPHANRGGGGIYQGAGPLGPTLATALGTLYSGPMLNSSNEWKNKWIASRLRELWWRRGWAIEWTTWTIWERSKSRCTLARGQDVVVDWWSIGEARMKCNESERKDDEWGWYWWSAPRMDETQWILALQANEQNERCSVSWCILHSL